MTKKSAETRLYILQKVAPVFNKHGFVGTSMKVITDAVGLTKGAIYGNFKDKEELAIEAFNYNVRMIMSQVAARIRAEESPLNQLSAMTNFYRNYLDFTDSNGGCPILNIGVDSNNQNERLLARVNEVIRKLERSMAEIILRGIQCGEMNTEVDAEQYSKRLFAMIQGAIFMTLTLGDKSYVVDMMDHIDAMIQLELKIN